MPPVKRPFCAKHIRGRLRDLMSIERGWFNNGNGDVLSGEAVTLEAFSTALREILYHQDHGRPYIYPTSDGGLSLEWGLEDVEDVLIRPDGRIYDGSD